MNKTGHSFTTKYDYEIDNINEFISDCTFKTPPMFIHVQNENRRIEKSFEVPNGFRLDQYVMSLFPNNLLEITFLTNSEEERTMKIEVKDQVNHNIIKTYLGVYQK